MMKDVTIIIPSYVTDKQSYDWLKECISSALLQDCQVVVYDDNSVVDPFVLLNEFDNVENLHVYKGSSHKGVSYARNRAVEHVSTSLILPLDCDDLLVEGAVDKLLSVWTGVPVYPDLSKFGLVEVPHYRLLDFSCDLLKEKLGISSVNVLHSIDQWRYIGGWNEQLDLYEDAEYNARLMLMYCGIAYHEPLVRYRQHASQRTRKIKDSAYSVEVSRNILDNLRRIQMGCPSCGGKRRTATNSMTSVAPVAVNPANLPGEQNGRVLSLYVGGKGQGAHYYKGISTHFAYKVVYGEYYYVDPNDATSSLTPGRRSLFVQVEKQSTIAKIEEKKLQEVVARTPVLDTVRTSVVEESSMVEESSAVNDSLPDISIMNFNEIKDLDLSDEDFSLLLSREESGRNRKGIINYLKNRIQK